MRKQPLLAIFTTALTITAGATFAGEQAATASSRTGETTTTTDPGAELSLAASASTVKYLVSPLTFSVKSDSGDAVLGAYVSPAKKRQLKRFRAHLQARLHTEALLAQRHEAWLRAHAARLAAVAAAQKHRAQEQTQAGGVWLSLRQCESGNDYAENTGNGYYGAYQFNLSTWWSIGFSGVPSQAPPAVQDHAAAMLEASRGWGPWPVCSAALGLH
ncbi:MAG: Transglycosylase domain protein [Acidimicrobiaceae bacterium]|nr:Transglycosylase domain protein [Acidimicrobiaceae bacterium]